MNKGKTQRRTLDRSTKRITRTQLVHLVRRVCVLLVSLYYTTTSIYVVVTSTLVLHGITSDLTTYDVHEVTLIPHYVGTTTIRNSALLKALGDVSTLRNDSMYLESPTSVSFSSCTTPNFNAEMYSNAHMRTEFALLQYGAYNLTFLALHELILPIVDCTFPPVVTDDRSAARVFYLTRLKSNPEDVYVMTVSFSLQRYAIPDLHREGAASVATFSLINDVRSTRVAHHFAVSLGYPYADQPVFEVYSYVGVTDDSQWILRSIPPNAMLEAPKTVHTARCEGFYIKAEDQQANYRNRFWKLETADAVQAMRIWLWHGVTVVRDSWAWVHYVRFVFAVHTMFNHCVLCLVIFQNARLGKIWVGDAFASISNALLYRGAIVLVTWQISGYWSIIELCLAYGHETAGVEGIMLFPSIVHADALTLFLGSTTVVDFVLKQRIDPVFTVIVFEVVFQWRLDQYVLDSSTREYIIEYARTSYVRGLVQLSDLLASKSPYRLSALSKISSVAIKFIMASVGPNWAISGALVVLFVLARVVHRRLHPESQYTTKTMPTEDATTQAKQVLTQFEIATGAELQNRFGVLTDYDNFVYFKGLKYASADGIYCNGFVIANGEYLVATEDILVIILMKVSRIRFRSVYVYDVDGSSLKKTARLVYPDTLKWSQLVRLNVSILS